MYLFFTSVYGYCKGKWYFLSTHAFLRNCLGFTNACTIIFYILKHFSLQWHDLEEFKSVDSVRTSVGPPPFYCNNGIQCGGKSVIQQVQE